MSEQFPAVALAVAVSVSIALDLATGAPAPRIFSRTLFLPIAMQVSPQSSFTAMHRAGGATLGGAIIGAT
jgi:hypothetical protein